MKLESTKVLSLELAGRIADEARAFAAKRGWKITTAIVDPGGQLVYFERHESIAAGTTQVAILKAQSAAAFQVPSKHLEDAVASGLVGMVGLPGMAAFEGAVPIRVEGRVIGAIAASGVTKEADGEIAQAGADSVEKILAE